MNKLIAGLTLAVGMALAGPAAADYTPCKGYNVNLNVNGTPFYGKWAIINDRPYVGVEAFAEAVGLPRVHYYKGWSVAEEPASTVDPLNLAVLVGDDNVDTLRFGGVTMIDLYHAASALDLPVHHNFTNKTIQVGSRYHGEMHKGEWYRRKSRARNWTGDVPFYPNVSERYRTENQDLLDSRKTP